MNEESTPPPPIRLRIATTPKRTSAWEEPEDASEEIRLAGIKHDRERQTKRGLIGLVVFLLLISIIGALLPTSPPKTNEQYRLEKVKEEIQAERAAKAKAVQEALDRIENR